ncbi:VOC family protein [Nocardia yamanashiensis]|uniref:VOC family protein n=1 Tax=Nocardia yamanashiensis TaxID=209247 RepID=UPI000832467A|nr:VOC family protein [Nocardia yamanashiensis]
MPGFARIRHVKLPVSDLARSVAWYCDLLGLELAGEFREQGVLRGAQLMHRSGFGIALREREYCVGKPDLGGFDVFALEVDSVDDLHALAALADELECTRGEVYDRGEYGAVLDIIDPDNLVVRFLANNPFRAGRFVGVDTDGKGGFSLYETPTLG